MTVRKLKKSSTKSKKWNRKTVKRKRITKIKTVNIVNKGSGYIDTPSNPLYASDVVNVASFKVANVAAKLLPIMYEYKPIENTQQEPWWQRIITWITGIHS